MPSARITPQARATEVVASTKQARVNETASLPAGLTIAESPDARVYAVVTRTEIQKTEDYVETQLTTSYTFLDRVNRRGALVPKWCRRN